MRTKKLVSMAVNAFFSSGSLKAASCLTQICYVITKNVEILLPNLEKRFKLTIRL